jgi:succinyl-CoA synthetase beta subunit
MKIHEYQAKQILSKYDVQIPRGEVAEAPSKAREIADKIGPKVVLKAQVHAGGRGKGGGIKLVNNAQEAEKIAKEMIGMTLVTPQTGPEGKLVKRILVEEALDIARELYIGIVIDRAKEAPVVMASSEGGVEIEKVAAETPELIFKEYINPATGFLPFQARNLAFKLNLEGDTFKQGVKFIMSLYKAFGATDASLAEINPLLITDQGNVLALDAKMNFDDNALLRHPDIKEMRDLDEEDRSRSIFFQLELHQTGWKRRLYGERSRLGHGNHGYHHALGRNAGKFPRCWRWSIRRSSQECF